MSYLKFAVTLAVLFAMSVFLQVRGEAMAPSGVGQGDELYLPSGSFVERLALSYDAIAADVYWIRAIQYYGGTKRAAVHAKHYELLYPLLDITTTLDPGFTIAYRFGAIFLAEAYPAGPGRPDLAIRLLEKGVRSHPEKWQYLQDIGFVHYWWLHDYKAAAEVFERASRVTGAPWWLQPLSATTLAQGGERRASRRLWQELSQNADNEWLRQEAQRRLDQLQVFDDLDRLISIVQRYIAERGALPRSWNGLIESGYLREIPRDPAGVPYVLDPLNQRLSASPESPLVPLPAEPPALLPVPSQSAGTF